MERWLQGSLPGFIAAYLEPWSLPRSEAPFLRGGHAELWLFASSCRDVENLWGRRVPEFCLQGLYNQQYLLPIAPSLSPVQLLSPGVAAPGA